MEALNDHAMLQRHSFPNRRFSVDESGERSAAESPAIDLH